MMFCFPVAAFPQQRPSARNRPGCGRSRSGHTPTPGPGECPGFAADPLRPTEQEPPATGPRGGDRFGVLGMVLGTLLALVLSGAAQAAPAGEPTPAVREETLPGTAVLRDTPADASAALVEPAGRDPQEPTAIPSQATSVQRHPGSQSAAAASPDATAEQSAPGSLEPRAASSLPRETPSAGIAVPPPAVTESAALVRFSPEQRRKLLAGEAVFDSRVTDAGTSGPKGQGRASVLVNAPADLCFRKFCEIDKHPLYFPVKKVSRVVEDRGTELVVYKELGFPLKTMKYFVNYTVDPAAHRVDFRLDKSRPHDIGDSEGYFHFIEVDARTTLFDYGLTKAEPGMPVPRFIRDYMTSHDLPRVVSNFKKWLESGGAWTK